MNIIMLLEVLKKLFRRDLNKLKTEIELYNNEEKLWAVNNVISNSAGNFALHLVGNLNAYIGAELGNTGYKRQRDLEFSLKDVSRAELLNQVDKTLVMVEKVLSKLTTNDLEKEYPLLVFKESMTTEYFLVHLTTHFSYHLGQINYHRRLLK